MATLIRTTFVKVISPAQGGRIAGCAILQKRYISGKSLRESFPPRPPKPAPFDYVNKDYTWFRSLFDRTTHRFDENSKVIVVEGPVAAGKTEFASALAQDLGMKHFPEANMDIHYIQQDVDLRIFNDKLPEDVRTFEHIEFNMTPNHRLAANYQIKMYMARFSQYIDALAHLLNTGEGVVLERSPFSDFVFLEAMLSQKHISKEVRSIYYELRNTTIEDLLRPHLVIYLDIPVDKVVQAVKKRGHKYEVEGKALTVPFLQEMERQYKNKYLRDISTHAELLVYDWSGGGEVEVVVEDIERLDFDQYSHRDEPKMKDWRLPREVEWADQRMIFTNNKHMFMNQFNIPRNDVPELITSADDMHAYNQLVYSHPKLKYHQGYNAEAGDTGLAMKSKTSKYTVWF